MYKKLKILINLSNLYVGGGVQVALSFLNQLRYLNKHNYYIILSKKLAEEIEGLNFPENCVFFLANFSPSSLRTRRFVLEWLYQLEEKVNPDIVFTLFGPAYWRPKTLHVMGFADPWVLNPESIAYKRLNFFDRIKTRLKCLYKKYYLKKDADYYIIETIDGKNKLKNLLKISENKIFVVENCCSEFFDDENLLKENNKYYIKLPKRKKGEFRFILISHWYPHKNIEIINKVIPLLKEYKIKFILTLEEKIYKKLFRQNEKYIINVGPISHKSCPSLYHQTDALFFPTLLEVFSVSYLEAMKMGKPILTSNYSFAKEICGDAALYFDPLSPIDIAQKIKLIINDKNLRYALIEKEKQRLKKFGTARDRASKYIEICEKLVKKN